MIERPIFVVAPPRSGGTALFRSLARAPGVFSASVPILDGIFELQPENREWDSNRLTAADVQPRVVEDLRGRLKGGLVDSSGNRPGIDATGLRWVDGQPRNALRVPFLAAVAPDSQFVYIHRDPAETIPAMLRVWEGGGRVSYSELPDWQGPAWSLPLVPGWRQLADKPVPEIVTEQWLRLTATVLDDLEALPPERWCVTDFKTLLNDPMRELERICEFVAIEASEDVTRPLRSLRDQLAVSDADEAGEVPEELRDLLPRTERLAERSRELLARPTTPSQDGEVVSAGGLAAAQRLHAELPGVPEPAAELAAGLDLPDGKADRRPLRRRPAQHPLPRLSATDGPRGGAGEDHDRHPRRGARLPELPGRRGEGRAPGQATMPAFCRGTSTSRATSGSTRSSSRRASSGWSRRTSRASRRLTPSTASCPAGSRRSFPSSAPRTGAT